MPELDVTRARALTPGCDRVLHLNHAGASLLPQPVLDAVVGHLRLEAEIGGYEAGAAAADRLEHTYDALAQLLGADPSELALVDSHTTAWNAAVHAFPVGERDRILVTRAEYGANAITLLRLRERTGCELVLVDDDADGQVDLAAFERALAEGPVAFASLVHAPTGSGLVNPAEEVGRLCRAAGVPLVLDACQSVGQLPVDVDAIGCDVLAASGRKFLRGPRGTGFLYVRAGLLPRLRPMSLDLQGAEWVAPDRYEVREGTRRFEQFEADVAARIGLGVAVDHALGWGIEAIAARVGPLAEGLRARLAAIDGVTVRDKGARRSAITTCTVDGVPAADVAAALRAQGINVSVTVPSYARFDLPHRGLDALVRASVHYVTTDDELDRAAAAIAALSAG
ncbi:MAG TPA: aminotransferase class V-fold PLP-dependent enzyme [Acidimicrobiales bacterium]|nr:aminotransferase class V-fold PLP-dependent enzyme [Acidimicrobiales bacterium]